jgi:hypothetical protein
MWLSAAAQLGLKRDDMLATLARIYESRVEQWQAVDVEAHASGVASHNQNDERDHDLDVASLLKVANEGKRHRERLRSVAEGARKALREDGQDLVESTFVRGAILLRDEHVRRWAKGDRFAPSDATAIAEDIASAFGRWARSIKVLAPIRAALPPDYLSDERLAAAERAIAVVIGRAEPGSSKLEATAEKIVSAALRALGFDGTNSKRRSLDVFKPAG